MGPRKKRAIGVKPRPPTEPAFDAQAFLDTAGVARKVVAFRRGEVIFAQGDPARTVMYIQRGGAKLSVISENGKQAVVAILGAGDFLGEGCLADQSIRMGTATAMTPSTLLAIDKNEMNRVLHAEHALSDIFIKFVLARNIRVEEDQQRRATLSRAKVARLVSQEPTAGSQVGSLGQERGPDPPT